MLTPYATRGALRWTLGGSTLANMAECLTCSTELEPEWKYCAVCGTPTARLVPQDKESGRFGTFGSRSGTGTFVREALKVARSRRLMITGIVVLLIIAAGTGVVLIALANS